MLTLLAAMATAVAMAGCGGKSASAPTKSSTPSTHKQPSRPPAY
jgi:ABC-type glycerol-3-phosphate transport system substrate-binding protein